MPRKAYIVAGLAVGFVFVLVFATFRYTPTPLAQSGGDRRAATRECHRAVLDQLPDSRFPTGASLASLDGGRLKISGSVDAPNGSEMQRRNYECFVRQDELSGVFLTDSVLVWQSH